MAPTHWLPLEKQKVTASIVAIQTTSEVSDFREGRWLFFWFVAIIYCGTATVYCLCVCCGRKGLEGGGRRGKWHQYSLKYFYKVPTYTKRDHSISWTLYLTTRHGASGIMSPTAPACFTAVALSGVTLDTMYGGSDDHSVTKLERDTHTVCPRSHTIRCQLLKIHTDT